jgi:hypothetical protein
MQTIALTDAALDKEEMIRNKQAAAAKMVINGLILLVQKNRNIEERAQTPKYPSWLGLLNVPAARYETSEPATDVKLTPFNRTPRTATKIARRRAVTTARGRRSTKELKAINVNAEKSVYREVSRYFSLIPPQKNLKQSSEKLKIKSVNNILAATGNLVVPRNKIT